MEAPFNRKNFLKKGTAMSTSKQTHANHTHQHGPGCGHVAVQHDGHVDYLHDGHLHHQNSAGAVEEHSLEVTRSQSQTPALPRMRAAATTRHTCMVPAAVIRPFRTAITWITWSTAICIIRTATTATTTGRSKSSPIDEFTPRNRPRRH